MTQVEAAKSKGPKKKLMLVRYGRLGLLGWFEHSESHIPRVASRVIIKTKRGLEMGEIVGTFNYREGQFRSTIEDYQDYYHATPRDTPLAEGGTFVRFATEEDLLECKHLEASAAEEAKTCERFIDEMRLPMKVVDAEHLFGGERIVIYFSSNGRVDFRELVRRLAREYQTRIELRQIGARDEARLVSDIETCGQQCCCRRFLKILDPVNMRMAKLQKATLDPSKISGHCGRLKCCLRYEDDIYREMKKSLPRKGAWVRTPDGQARIVEVQVLSREVVVENEQGKRQVYDADEVTPTDAPPRPVPAEAAGGADAVDAAASSTGGTYEGDPDEAGDNESFDRGDERSEDEQPADERAEDPRRRDDERPRQPQDQRQQRGRRNDRRDRRRPWKGRGGDNGRTSPRSPDGAPPPPPDLPDSRDDDGRGENE